MNSCGFLLLMDVNSLIGDLPLFLILISPVLEFLLQRLQDIALFCQILEEQGS